jgi:hypothetical protein
MYMIVNNNAITPRGKPDLLPFVAVGNAFIVDRSVVGDEPSVRSNEDRIGNLII